ncbi:MAG: hypothetical protein ABJC62_13090, partial [Frankiaceae bacterium]
MDAKPATGDAGLYDVADRVTAWRTEGRRVLLARTVSVAGSSSRWPNQVLAFTPVSRPPERCSPGARRRAARRRAAA